MLLSTRDTLHGAHPADEHTQPLSSEHHRPKNGKTEESVLHPTPIEDDVDVTTTGDAVPALS